MVNAMGLFDKLRGKKPSDNNAAKSGNNEAMQPSAYVPDFSTDYDTAAFFFIKLPISEAKKRYDSLNLGNKKPLNEPDGVEFGVVDDWSVFADYLPDFNCMFDGEIPAFMNMAKREEAIFAYYQTDSCSAFLFGKKDGAIIRELIDDMDMEEDNKNIGSLLYEKEPVTDWVSLISLIHSLLGKE
jgi:hypothetical protein